MTKKVWKVGPITPHDILAAIVRFAETSFISTAVTSNNAQDVAASF